MRTIHQLSAITAALVASAGLLLGGAGTAGAEPATVAVDGTDPIATGCAADAITARDAYGAIGGVTRVYVELRYSPRCRTAWARVTTQNMPNCVPGADYCGGATVHRNSDGREYGCAIPGGARGCYTPQVNDSGVTSFARGHADYGANTAYATTGSY
ncbi:DUF2690 domain-containing protein [Actinokineospora iranica]|uniref:DUF2690 domain-containing protein n=1 Tax=Actinokineospora iranica TaxID=1271860 RepID=A0A1G6NJM3_9PSEU|nr:DUF2690 domain-containing protein [Actinokineospora iranica]SDC68162.1 Protein of unknown function [Actinokineospora iranica]